MVIRRYLIQEISKSFAVTLTVLVGIFFAYSAAKVVGQVAEGKLGWDVAPQIMALQAFIALETLLPTALYVGVLVGLQRLHRDSEVAVLAALGFGLGATVRTVFGFALPVALLAG